jgi:hypothetical protein
LSYIANVHGEREQITGVRSRTKSFDLLSLHDEVTGIPVQQGATP